MPLILRHLSIHTKFLLPITTMGFDKDHHFAIDFPISFQLFLWLYLQVFLQLSMWLYLWLQASSSRSTYLHFLENFALFATILKLKVNLFAFFKEFSSLRYNFISFYNFCFLQVLVHFATSNDFFPLNLQLHFAYFPTSLSTTSFAFAIILCLHHCCLFL
jgi:hypothetical protein